MLIRRFVLKVINNEIKDLTHHEITGCIAEQTVLVITQGCKESKMWIHLKLRRPSLSFSYFCSLTFVL